MLKLYFKWKKKIEEKGFTLVELIAVIVIIAIIMLIAIPAVLNSVESAKRKTFDEYITKSASLAQQKYSEQLLSENYFGGNCIIYDIETDLGLDNTGKFKGYILLNAQTNDIYVTLYDDSYAVSAYHFNNSKSELIDKLERIGSIEEESLSKDYLCSHSNCNSCTYKEGTNEKSIVADKESNENAINNGALMISGQDFNLKLRQLYNPNLTAASGLFNDITELRSSNTLKDTTDKLDVSTPESKYRIWIWKEEGTVYYYTDAPSGIFLNADCQHMFTNLRGLRVIDVSKWNTSIVENAYMMFGSCEVEELDLSGFNTSNMTNMGYMFSYTEKLKKLDISNFDTSKVTNMQGMFMGCFLLEELDLSHFKTSKITSMRYMFYQCESLKKLNIRGFDTSNVTTMYMTFDGCKNLTTFDFSYLNTSKVTNMKSLFHSCEKLVEVNLTNIDTSKVTDMSGMFGYCRSLKTIDATKLNTSNVTDMDGMFTGCESLTSLDVTSFDTSKVTRMGTLFSDCKNLVILDLSSFNTSNVVRMSWMFYNCEKLKTIYVGTGWNTSNVTDHYDVFENCTLLPHYNSAEIELEHANYSSTGYLTKK